MAVQFLLHSFYRYLLGQFGKRAGAYSYRVVRGERQLVCVIDLDRVSDWEHVFELALKITECPLEDYPLLDFVSTDPAMVDAFVRAYDRWDSAFVVGV